MTFQHVDLRLAHPAFGSPLVETVMELNHIKRQELGGTTAPWIFFQLKEIFHMMESIGSTRIEGNHTTISEYVEQKIEKKERSTDRFSEIANVEQAMNYIEREISEGAEITHMFIRELHHLAVDGLEREGDPTPGAYRAKNVKIASADHTPPDHSTVVGYMDELLDFINSIDSSQFDLLKTAIAHHRFLWIHPFNNGNGRAVRLLTYAMMIKYGFNVKEGKLLNPTAVFCNDRNLYYDRLSQADRGDDKSVLAWCEYVLRGILEEITKVNKLLDFSYLYSAILVPTVEHGIERGFLNDTERQILMVGIKKQSFQSTDVSEALPQLTRLIHQTVISTADSHIFSSTTQ